MTAEVREDLVQSSDFGEGGREGGGKGGMGGGREGGGGGAAVPVYMYIHVYSPCYYTCTVHTCTYYTCTVHTHVLFEVLWKYMYRPLCNYSMQRDLLFPLLHRCASIGGSNVPVHSDAAVSEREPQGLAGPERLQPPKESSVRLLSTGIVHLHVYTYGVKVYVLV